MNGFVYIQKKMEHYMSKKANKKEEVIYEPLLVYHESDSEDDKTEGYI